MNQTKPFIVHLMTGLTQDPAPPDIILLFGKYLKTPMKHIFIDYILTWLGLQPVTYNCETLRKFYFKCPLIIN